MAPSAARCRIAVSLALAASAALAAAGFRPAAQEREEAQRHANRGIALLEQFRFAEAVEELEALVALEPDAAAAWVNLAIAQFNVRDFDAALAALDRAGRLAPESPHVHYNLGLIYKLQGRTEEAVSAFEKVAQSDPEDAMTQYHLGTLYSNLGRLDDAVARLRTAIRIQPNNESAHFTLGNVLIRQGKVEEGRAELEIFRKLKESFPAEAASAGLQYTELGPYAEAIEEPSLPLQPEPAEKAVASGVVWAEATEAAGLALPALPAPPEWPAVISSGEYDLDFIASRLLPHFGSGLAFRDADADGDPDLFFVRGGAPWFFRNEGGRFVRDEASGLPDEGRFVSLTMGDVDGDGDPELYLVGPGPNALFLNDGTGSFSPAGAVGVEGADVSVAATFADVDHDGDLDLYVANYLSGSAADGERLQVPFDLEGAPNRLYRNDGNGGFTEIGAESRTDGGRRRSLGAVFSDLDDDRDVDFVVVNDGEALQVFSNDRVGTFTESSLAWKLEAPGRRRGVSVGDFDRDGSFDVFATAEGGVLNALLRGPAASGFRPDVLSPALLAAGAPGGRFGTSFLDADNDADLDLLLVVNEPGVLAAYYENRPSGFVRAGELRASEEVGAGRALAVADVDGDGDLDALVGTDRGGLVLFRNDGGNERGFLRVVARGLRSNRDGLGTKVEVRAGDARLRREIRASGGFLSQNELPLHFGLGEREAADYVRLLWPGGVKQIEMDVGGNRTLIIEELNRKGTSCPILYAWDGERMRFVTDFLGGSAMGYLLAPGRYNVPDTDEYVKLDEFPLGERDGRIELAWVNQLEEVLMYDKASLLAVDHPEEVEVFPNERLMPGPPYPEPRLYAVQRLRAPVSATDGRGRDVTALVAEKDRAFPSDFELLPFKGYAKLHSLTLDLGELPPDAHPVLLLYGWVDYADSSSNLAAAQAGVSLTPPFLEIETEPGVFRPGLEQMGFPAGLPKTMLVDLGEVWRPGVRRVRVTTSMRIYWDWIRMAEVVPDAPVKVTELAPARAELRFKGYPRPFRPDGREPVTYDYERASTEELWDAHEGAYTRYGDVRPLLEAVDDRYAITRHGDEVALGFDLGDLPATDAGWTRTFLMFADGFGKDMDLNSARPDTVEPLPFHGMSAYPYPPHEHYPDTDEHRRYRETYNTRWVERQKMPRATPE